MKYDRMGRKFNSTERRFLKREIRPTPFRLSIYRHLRRRKSAASFGEIMEKFAKRNKKDKTADRSTFFRTLKLFEEKGLVHQIDDGTGIIKYAITKNLYLKRTEPDLHMHFHCASCGKTFCLPNEMDRNNLPDGHKIDEVNTVLKGTCENCLKKQIVK